MDDDRTLLNQYARDGSRAAFERLVERYVDLVFSAALRQVGDRHLAEDVTQGVFIVLARKARSLGGERVLGAWLLRVARYAAIDALKAAGRRRKHEERAASMRPETTSDQGGAGAAAPADEAAQWAEIRGLLDEAVVGLPARDRQAVVLRFFEQRSVDEVARRMGVTREAAKQRLFRAIEKLRRRLGAKGATAVPAAAVLVGLIGARSVEAAPVGLAGSATATATTGAAVVGSAAAAAGIAKGTVTIMAWTNVKIAAAVAAGVLLVGSTTAIVATRVIGPTDGAGRSSYTVPVIDHNPAGADQRNRPAGAADWRTKFAAVYALADGEVVKRVPPPFIDERWNFWKSQQPGIPPLKPGEAMPEKTFAISWDGRDYRWQMAGLGDTRLAEALRWVGGIRPVEIVGADELREMNLPGDWVYDKRATQAERVAGVQAVARKASGKRITIRQARKPRAVIVVVGTMMPQGPFDASGRPIIELCAGERAKPAPGSPPLPPQPPRSMTLREVFDQAADWFDMPFIDESGSDMARVMVNEYPGVIPGNKHMADYLTPTLDSFTGRTGLDFKRETRELDVWEIVEEKD